MKRLVPMLLSCLLIFTAGCSDSVQPASSPSAASFAVSEENAGSLPSSAADLQSSSAASSGATASSKAPSSNPPQTKATSSGASSHPAPSGTPTVTVTVPEGYTLAKIAAKLEANGVCKGADFIKSAQTYDFSNYSLVNKIPSSSKRAYKLEGYLYPDTYTLYQNMKPQDAVGKFLRNAQQRISGKYGFSGMTTDQVVTLASIVEKESDDISDMKLVSSVFHNRLKAGMKLQADSTIAYCTGCLLAPNGPFSDKFKYYYNTYRCGGLPAGPICNPGANSLSAAANPTSSDYLYFITKGGKYYYQKTLEEHEAKLKELGMASDSSAS